jgi:hypothetical protein
MDGDKEIKQPEMDINRYQSQDSPSSKKLELGLWLINNKQNLRRVLIVFLTVVAAVSWSYTIYGFAYYIAKGMKQDELLVKQLAETQTIGHEYIVSLAPKNISLAPTKIFRGDENKYDFYAEIKNPNSKYWAIFDYCFLEQNQEVECGKDFILPEDSKSLMALAKNFNYLPRTANLVLKDIAWRKINQREISNWPAFRDDHLNFSLTGITFRPSAVSGLSEKLNLNTLEFSAFNKTAFNYWEAPLAILFYNGNTLVGINRYVLSEFMSKENRNVKISWPGNLSNINSVKIMPDLNIFDDDVYIKYEGGIGEEK